MKFIVDFLGGWLLVWCVVFVQVGLVFVEGGVFEIDVWVIDCFVGVVCVDFQIYYVGVVVIDQCMVIVGVGFEVGVYVWVQWCFVGVGEQGWCVFEDVDEFVFEVVCMVQC